MRVLIEQSQKRVNNCHIMKCLFLLVLVFFSQNTNSFIPVPRGSLSVGTGTSNQRSSFQTRLSAASNNRLSEFRSAIFSIVRVITTTGPRPVGIRTLQVAGAVNKLLREFAQNQKLFQDSNGRLVPARIAKRLFEELGATYIKLGQFIASSPTLFPADYVLEFQSCLDNTPKVTYTKIRKIIQDDLGRPLSSVYAYVDPVPLASASVAQVHRAKLKNGTEVAIKVRKPGVDTTLEADLSFLLIASKIIEFLNPSLARLSFSNIVGDLRNSMVRFTHSIRCTTVPSPFHTCL